MSLHQIGILGMDSKLRDIGLLLLGAALVKSERNRVLNSIPTGSLIEELDKLLDSMRATDQTPMREWLSNRGVKIENGKDAVQALIEAIDDERHLQKVRRVCAELSFAVKLENKDEIVERLEKCLLELKK